MIKLALPAVLALSTLTATAQNVVQVSGGGDALHLAAQAAPPGSTFIVAPDRYNTPTWAAQDATLIAPQGATLLGYFIVPGSAGSLTMRNFTIVSTSRSTPYGSYPDPGRLASTGADLVLDNCSVRGVSLRDGTLVASGCLFSGSASAGAAVSNASAAFIDCRISGGIFFSSYGPFSSSYQGMSIAGSSVRLERTSVSGASAVSYSGVGAVGISVSGNSVLTVADGSVSGGADTSGTAYASAISITTNASATLSGVQLVGAVSGPHALGQLASASWSTRDLTVGGTSTAVFQDQPNTPGAIVAALDVSPFSTPLVAEDLFVFGTTNWFPLATGVTDPTGQLSLSLTLPNQPGIQNQQLWLTGLFGSSLPIRSTAPLGGIIE